MGIARTVLKHAFSSGSVIALATGMALAEAPGTDSFGNSITSSKFDSSIPTNLFYNISGTGTLLASGDDVSATNTALGGLVFPFYGTNYSNLTFATNGYISTDPTDTGPDLSNDPTLPSTPSTGGGARIYAYHDDTVANIYGQYFDQASSPIGTETYIAQWNARHYSGPGTIDDSAPLRYNVMLLRDGTIVMAYDKVSSEAGSGATVGIQNDGATDGVAYLADEGVMTDGMTIVVYSPTSGLFPPTPFGGLADDLTITGSEIGMLQTAAQNGLTTEQVREAFSKGEPAPRISTKGSAATAGDDRYSVWASGSATATTGTAGPVVNGRNLGFHVGADYLLTPRLIAGLSFGYAQASLSTGMLTTNATGYTVSPYAGYEINNNLFVKASVDYTRTIYDDVTMPLGTFTSASNRFSGSLTAEGRFATAEPGLSIVPAATLTVGTEVFEPLRGMGMTIPVQRAWFVRGEATAKFEQSFSTAEGNGKIYVLAGADYVRTNGDNSIALFATAYDNARLGGVLGGGVSFDAPNGFSIDANFSGTGLATTSRAGQASLTVGFRF